MTFSRKIVGMTAAMALSFAASAAMAATVTITVTNSTGKAVMFQTGGGFQGTPSPAFKDLPAGGSVTVTIASPYASSTGGSFYYQRDDNLKRCFFVPSRTKTTGAAWNYPTANATASGTGVSCSATITKVDTGTNTASPTYGNWEVNFTIK